MSDHYNWRCDSCASVHDIHTDDFTYRISKDLIPPFSGKLITHQVKLCRGCVNKLFSSKILTYRNTDQTFCLKDVRINFDH